MAKGTSLTSSSVLPLFEKRTMRSSLHTMPCKHRGNVVTSETRLMSHESLA